MLLACGAALLNLRLAIRALGVHPAVQLLPDPNRPNLLAVVRLQGTSPAALVDRRLAEAIPAAGTTPDRWTPPRPFRCRCSTNCGGPPRLNKPGWPPSPLRSYRSCARC